MWTSILSGISNFFSAIGGLFGYETQKDKQLNTPQMEANRQAEIDQKEHEKITRDVAQNNIEAERRDIAD